MGGTTASVQPLACALANATHIDIGADSKTQKAPILHAHSAVGYNPLLGRCAPSFTPNKRLLICLMACKSG
jgi:hypothetical protein